GVYFPRDPQDPAFQGALGRVVGGLGVAVAFGAVSYELPHERGGMEKIWNSALLAGKDGTFRGWSDKVHLLLFGESVPILGSHPELMRRFFPNSSQMMAGERLVPLVDGDLRIAPLVCYE